jgi:YggT family protein
MNPADVMDMGMIILSNFLVAIATVLKIVLNIYMWVVIAQAVLSWVSPDPYNPIVRFINNVTEPVLYLIRKRLPLNFGGIDFSPMLVILAIIFLQQFVVNSLYGLAISMR